MRIRPIPRKLLIHTVEYHQYKPADSSNSGTNWGSGSEGSFEEPVTIKLVRIEPSSKVIIGASSQQLQEKAILYYDTTHSAPKHVNFVRKSKVIFQGQTHFIEQVDPLYALGDEPHHYELRLI
ncbi:putative minor capsid protein [Halobacillus sp. Cin3]|uniref:putative minor capsid protein n=1 Tax=Halobacillus sp. Cin3 TaxID=2928441 RepID=UPI00248E8035|nr:putative minor capsid protein [Halobacillus sp. Cin3]